MFSWKVQFWRQCLQLEVMCPRRMILVLLALGPWARLLEVCPRRHGCLSVICLPLKGAELYIPVCVWMADTVTSPYGRLLLAPRPGCSDSSWKMELKAQA